MLTLEPIGHIASCWPEKFGTPRQGSVVPSSTAELVLAPGALDGAASADGLAAFSHVWLVWHVHLNEGSAPSAKVQAPHLRQEVPRLLAHMPLSSTQALMVALCVTISA